MSDCTPFHHINTTEDLITGGLNCSSISVTPYTAGLSVIVRNWDTDDAGADVPESTTSAIIFLSDEDIKALADLLNAYLDSKKE